MAMKVKNKFPLTLILLVTLFVILYQFAYLFPFTNNAFVVANVRPVAANVSGYITDIYVKNEEYVKKGQPLFTVFKTPYELAFKKATSDVGEARAQLIVIKKRIEKTIRLINSQKALFEKKRFIYEHNRSALSDHAVSKIKVHTALKEKKAALNQLRALEKELELNREQITVQKMKIDSLSAVMKNAKVNLDETTVYARNTGSIQDMFVALGTPVKIRKPLFSFVDTETMFIQANFLETEVRRVHPGSHVTIFPRMYLGSKTYHGRVFSKQWAVSRLSSYDDFHIEVVRNSVSNWFLLPQRLPIQIQITDYDPIHYPLSVGASAYVYISTFD